MCTFSSSLHPQVAEVEFCSADHQRMCLFTAAYYFFCENNASVVQVAACTSSKGRIVHMKRGLAELASLQSFATCTFH